jgi:hypothetical protein
VPCAVKQNFFEQWYLNNLTENEMFAIVSLLDFMFIKEGLICLNSQINDIITAMVTS